MEVGDLNLDPRNLGLKVGDCGWSGGLETVNWGLERVQKRDAGPAPAPGCEGCEGRGV